jgi:hypothetical protein
MSWDELLMTITGHGDVRIKVCAFDSKIGSCSFVGLCVPITMKSHDLAVKYRMISSRVRSKTIEVSAGIPKDLAGVYNNHHRMSKCTGHIDGSQVGIGTISQQTVVSFEWR